VGGTQVTSQLLGSAIVEMAGVLTRRDPYGGASLSQLIGADAAANVMGALATISQVPAENWLALLAIGVAMIVIMKSALIMRRRLVRHSDL
jgi:hypothetical protein